MPKATVNATPATTALATPSADSILSVGADANLDALELAGIGGDSVDGLAEVSAADLRTPLKLYNLRRAEGVQRIAQDQFLDTIDRTVSSELELVLLDLHRTNLYAVFDQKEQRNATLCSSYDQQTGHWQSDGHPRPCHGCPDAQWRTEDDGKRVQPCSETWNVAAFDLQAQRVCLVKFRRTSLDAIRTYLQAHHFGRRPLPGGKRGNIPLFAYRVKVTLSMHKSGNYAVPVIERGPMLSVGDLKVMVETSAAVRQTFELRMRAAEASAGDAGEGGAPPDTSFDTDSFADGINNAPDDGPARGSVAFVE